MNRLRVSRFALGLLIAAPLFGQQIQINKENKTIAISTSGEAFALADTALVHIGFITYSKDQSAIYADASRISNAIMTTLKDAGTPKEAVESNSQELSPLEPNGDNEKALYAQGMRFHFSQSWTVTVPADQAAKLLHLAITAGANDSGNIDWQLRHDDSLEAEAAGKALAHAREIAERMAKGLGAKLGPLVYASNQTPARGIFGNMGFGNVELNTSSSAMAVRKNFAPLAISPDRITKSATVYAVFAIE